MNWLSQCHTCYESKFDLAKEIVALLMMSVGFSGNAIGFPRLAIHFVIMHVLRTGSGIGLPRRAKHFWMYYTCCVYLKMEVAVPVSHLL